MPRHHELDKARFIGTADCVMTQDPDSGWFNLGAYRSQVYDGKTVGCQITEGKHGRISVVGGLRRLRRRRHPGETAWVEQVADLLDRR